eukprot:CAMPEP_0196738986 /NCGR_PEP_ID=MMETSP1091-20130531/18421_1 /TAXON_ID=302021 /ORGANISM="Rhodomonas sp., Strain CCMP768" /LENGTH=96 /DNA_ID=CAMNT_0042083165 /DNA_START=18 /DNA_END=308 /DNA_ORIENTATION=+
MAAVVAVVARKHREEGTRRNTRAEPFIRPQWPEVKREQTHYNRGAEGEVSDFVKELVKKGLQEKQRAGGPDSGKDEQKSKGWSLISKTFGSFKSKR